jgi:hypothetical protein
VTLGPPIRPAPPAPEEERWLPHPKRKGIEISSKTGYARTALPLPPEAPPPEPVDDDEGVL